MKHFKIPFLNLKKSLFEFEPRDSIMPTSSRDAVFIPLRQVPRRYLAAYMREAGRLSLSTVPHAKILQALKDSGRDSAAAVFEQQWRRGVAELEAWVTRAAPTRVPA